MNHKIAQINLPARAKKSQSAGDILIAQPDSIKESLAGKLIVLVEISQAGKSGAKLASFLPQQLSANFYQSDKIVLRERISTLKPEHIFETALAKTNKDLANFLKQEKARIPYGAISATAVLVYGDEIHFASAGKNRVLLFYPKPNQANGKDEFAYTDLGKAAAEPAAAAGEAKLFRNVISGRLPSKSSVLIANEALSEYVSEKKLLAIMGALSPAGAAEQIKSLLAEVNSYVSFQAAIIRQSRLGAEAGERAAAETGRESFRLSAAESETEKILSPSGLFSLKRWHGLFGQSGRNARPALAIELKDRIYAKERSLFSLKKLAKAILSFLSALYGGLGRLLRLILGADGLKSAPKNLLLSLRLAVWKTMRGLSGLRRRNQLLLFLALASAVLLAVNISANKRQQAEVAETREFEALTAEIERKQHQAEASLLYSNEEGAQKLFAEITALMEKLPQVTDDQRAAYEDFQSRLEGQLEKTRRVVRFQEKEMIADFKNIDPAAAPESLFLLEPGKRLYAANPANGSVYIVGLEDAGVTVAADISGASAGLRFPAGAGEGTVYYFSDGGIIELKADSGQMQVLPINLLGDAGQFAGAATYNSRYYLLNRAGNQVYRYARSGGSFSAPYAWVQEAANLGKAAGLAIDGYVYILLEDGGVLKFLSGKSVDFRLEAVEPPLSAPSAIHASAELKHLYILEPAGGRLLLFDKSGQFLEQYKDDFLARARGFAIDEGAKQMYFLGGTEVLRTPARHLEEDDAAD